MGLAMAKIVPMKELVSRICQSIMILKGTKFQLKVWRYIKTIKKSKVSHTIPVLRRTQWERCMIIHIKIIEGLIPIHVWFPSWYQPKSCRHLSISNNRTQSDMKQKWQNRNSSTRWSISLRSKPKLNKYSYKDVSCL